jgi:branched-chain amino acid transport system substrate-binding protein
MKRKLAFDLRFSRRTVFAGATAIAASLAAISLPSLAQEPLKIGYSMARSGLFAQATQSQYNAYQLWQDKINEQGGLDVAGEGRRPVEFIMYDDQSNPGQAVKIYEKLITDDKVDLLLAPWGTPFQIAIAPVLERYKFPVVGNSAASVQLKTIKPGYIWFPTSAIPDRVGPALADMLKAQGAQTVAVFANTLPFTKEVKTFLIPSLEKNGIKVTVDEDYPPDIKDMTALLDRAKGAQPDALVALSYPPDSVLFAKQAKELGVVAPFVFSMVGPTMDFYQKAMGPAAENVVTLGHWSPNRDEWTGGKAFYDAYKQKFNEIPDHLNSALAWMSLEILEDAVAKVGLDREKLRETIATETFDTINGPVKFEGVENVITPTAFLQIQGDQLEIVWPQSIKTESFRPKESW